MADPILELLPDGVVVAGPGGRVEAMNAEAERLSGWTRGEAEGRLWHEVLPLRDAGGLLVHEHGDPYRVSLSITRGTPEREYLLRDRAGTERWVALRATYQRDGDGTIGRAVVSVRDIARRKRLDRARSDLISTVSHEIRSPLTSVKGFTSTLLHKWDRFNDEQKQHMLSMINADADRVTRLLTDLLDVSRLEAGRLELRRQQVDVGETVAAVVERLRHAAERHRIEIEVPDDLPKISADPGKLDQVLVNLIENGLKYADPGRILVRVASPPEEIRVSVADEGPGIDPRHHAHLFTKFYRRGHGERRSGTGLGLYICKGIVEAHGGWIGAERSRLGGTVFTFALPRTNG